MQKVFAASIATFVVLGVGFVTSGTARANDRELRVVLDRLACVPVRVVRTDPSPILVIYEVTCKRTGQVLQVACLESECWLQTQPGKDDEPVGGS
jgi:hypothetical protein